MKHPIRQLAPLAFLAAVTWLLASCASPETSAPAPAVSVEADSNMPWNAPATGASSQKSRAVNASAAVRRPGLGTGWGETVSSQVGYSSFTRASSKPAGVASIYYNDKEGVAAMNGTWKYSGSGMQRAAGGLVEWGVKGGWSMLKNYNSGGRRYVVGRKGSDYALVVKNLSRSTLEIVLSVDGLDVMDGKTASFKKRGYIIQPGKTLTVKGFRTSEAAVAAFKFSSVAGSYANLKHGKTRNVGVIGMAVFTQQGVDPWKWSNSAVQRRHSASPFAEAPSTRAR
ncbi:hypothetical protein JIN77_12210 [Verrucomicrobiaceae bacterium R5-34]|nr:hypothetical protein [Verrucomicrobiaceae bacterium R5-34]